MSLTLLICPQCSKKFKRINNELLCDCGLKYGQKRSGFYDFRLNELQPDQKNGLKSHMEEDFYCNDRFRDFLANQNLSRLKRSIKNLSHETVMDH